MCNEHKSFLVRIVDDDPSFCDAITYMLTLEGWEVKSYRSVKDFIKDDTPSRDGVLLLDVHMPDINGLALQEKLIDGNYQQPIIFITAHGNVDLAVEVLRKGAYHFLQKPIKPKVLLDAIGEAFAFVQEKKDPLGNDSEISTKIDALTSREKEVAALLSEGLLNSEIAKQLHLSIRTIEVYRANVYLKLGVKNVAAVARIWKKYLKQAPNAAAR